MYSPDNLHQLFIQAFNHLIRKDKENILNTVSERNLCGRLAIYLHEISQTHNFHNYYADVEYNRNKGEIKTVIDEDNEIVNVTCDLILHSRGKETQDNLIAIEMKKSYRPEDDKEKDRQRLRALTAVINTETTRWVREDDKLTPLHHVCGYILGYYIEFNQDNGSYIVEKYQNGNRLETSLRGDLP